MNGDGNLDLIVPDRSNYAVAVFYRKGDGTFPTSAEFPADLSGRSVTRVAVGDFRKIGKLDIVVAVSTGCCPFSGGIGVLLNNGNCGIFQVSNVYSTDNGPQSVVLADFNGDKKLDFTVDNASGLKMA